VSLNCKQSSVDILDVVTTLKKMFLSLNDVVIEINQLITEAMLRHGQS